MAQKELIRADYDSIKTSLANGQSINTVAKAFKLGNRRVALIAKSKSWNSYIALRAVERKKRAENTPAKAPQGGHELPQGTEAETTAAGEFVDTAPNGDTVPHDKVKINADGSKEDLRTPTEIDEAEMQKREREMRDRMAKRAAERRRSERFGQIFAFSIIGLAVVGAIALVWGAIYLLTK